MRPFYRPTPPLIIIQLLFRCALSCIAISCVLTSTPDIQRERDPKKKKKSRMTNQEGGIGGDDASSEQTANQSCPPLPVGGGSQSRRGTDTFYSRGSLKSTAVVANPIILGGKYMLPKEAVKKANDEARGVKPRHSYLPSTHKSLKEIESESESDSDGSSDKDGNDDDAREDTEEARQKREKPKPLRKRETAEEKRVRKAQVCDTSLHIIYNICHREFHLTVF